MKNLPKECSHSIPPNFISLISHDMLFKLLFLNTLQLDNLSNFYPTGEILDTQIIKATRWFLFSSYSINSFIRSLLLLLVGMSAWGIMILSNLAKITFSLSLIHVLRNLSSYLECRLRDSSRLLLLLNSEVARPLV